MKWCSLVEVSFNQSSYGVMEDDGTVSLVIALSQPSSVPFEVIVQTINVTAVGEYAHSIFYVHNCKYHVVQNSGRVKHKKW